MTEDQRPRETPGDVFSVVLPLALPPAGGRLPSGTPKLCLGEYVCINLWGQCNQLDGGLCNAPLVRCSKGRFRGKRLCGNGAAQHFGVGKRVAALHHSTHAISAWRDSSYRDR